jgi:hypothetical protein
MIREFTIGLAFIFSASFYAVGQDIPAAVDKPAENRLAVETADLVQPAGKGIATKKQHKGVVSTKKYGKLTKEQSEAVRNLDKEYAKLIDILQVRIELLKKEREQKIAELVVELKKQKEQATTPNSAAPPKAETAAATETEKEKPKNTRPRRIL